MKNTMKLKATMRLGILCLCATIAFAHNAGAQIANGGNYTLTQTAIASGGASGAGANGNYSLEGTTGQVAAGTKQQNAAYTFHSGFWTAQSILAPTAAEVTVGGRVLTASGKGIRNVSVTLTWASGESRTVISGASGNFQFTDVEVGATYIFSASAKHYQFSQPTLVRNIIEDTDDINFVGISSSLRD